MDNAAAGYYLAAMMPPRRRSALLLVLVICLGYAPASQAQVPLDTVVAAPPALDARGVLAVNGVEAPAFAFWMRAVDASAYPVFFGAPPVAWGVALAQGDRGYAAAYRLTISEATTFGLASGLKALVRRPRPYVALPGVQLRTRKMGRQPSQSDFYSFPSGHAATAAVIATSWSLSHPRWYVIAPGAVWAASVAASRLWLGVHYPSDVLSGALLGAGVGTLVYVLRDAITPAALEGSADDAPPMVRLRLRLP